MTQPTKLKIWCETCRGLRWNNIHEHLCKDCKGLGYTEIEPLEVEIFYWLKEEYWYVALQTKDGLTSFRATFNSKQEAIDWCEQKGLRVVND